MNPTYSCKGFTLMEILTAIAIFSLIAAGCYGFLASVINASEQTSTRASQLGAMQKTFSILESDLAQIVSSPRVRGSETLAWVSGDATNLRFVSSRAKFFGGLSLNACFTVAYALDNSETSGNVALARYSGESCPLWNISGEQSEMFLPEPTTVLRRQEMMDKVTSIRFRYLSRDHEWTSVWPLRTAETGREDMSPLKREFTSPMAVEVLLEHVDFGQIRRIFELPAGFPSFMVKEDAVQ